MKKKPVRVLHVVRKMDLGGVQSFIMNYYRNIDTSNVQFDFVCQDPEEGYFDKEIYSLGGKIHYAPPLKEIFSYYLYLHNLLKVNSYEIIHVHQNFANIHSLIIAYFNGVNERISHSHNSYPERLLIKKIIKKIITTIINRVATINFACSIEAGNWLYGKSNSSNKKYLVMRNAIDIELFKYDTVIREQVRNELGIENNKVIGHVGNFNDQKNHVFLLEVIRELSLMGDNYHFILVGKGEHKQKITEKILAYNLSERVTILEDRNDISRLMQGFDVFVLPSLYEGLGIVGIEAQTAGLKCIMSNSIPEEVDISGNVIKLSLSCGPKKWASTLKYTLDLKNDRETFYQNSIKSGYDIVVEARKLENIYSGIKDVM